MNIVTDIESWIAIRNNIENKTIGFVPTMGNLHEGHLSLCHRARSENKITVVSIFVNPTQFNEKSDYETYPRTLKEDQLLLENNKIDYLFMPTMDAIYHDQYQVQVLENHLSRELEGEFRPGHFSGMLTIVMKLFNLVRPNRAYFGEKDYQQYLLIRKMVNALFMPLEVIPCETVRSKEGLALSSRNSRLSEEGRLHAAHFPRLLRSNLDKESVIAELIEHGFKVDYVQEKWGRRLAAVWLEDVRLIDNIEMKRSV